MCEFDVYEVDKEGNDISFDLRATVDRFILTTSTPTTERTWELAVVADPEETSEDELEDCVCFEALDAVLLDLVHQHFMTFCDEYAEDFMVATGEPKPEIEFVSSNGR